MNAVHIKFGKKPLKAHIKKIRVSGKRIMFWFDTQGNRPESLIRHFKNLSFKKARRTTQCVTLHEWSALSRLWALSADMTIKGRSPLTVCQQKYERHSTFFSGHKDCCVGTVCLLRQITFECIAAKEGWLVVLRFNATLKVSS